ncbi:MAG TPA: hypothetical protein VGK20_18970 [Candidatus Binatia bacterium]
MTLRRALLLFVVVAVVAAWLLGRGAADRPAPVAPAPEEEPAWKARGRIVEARFGAYRDELQQTYEKLATLLETEAPDLAARLKETPPSLAPVGYGLLPLIVEPDPASHAAPAARAESKSYSWPWTEVRIDTELRKLGAFREQVASPPPLEGAARRRFLERLVETWRSLHEALENIDDHVHYNQLWQAAVAADRAGYDRGTGLHDAVVERQALLDALAATDDTAFAAALAQVPAIDPGTPRAQATPLLRQREAALAARIREATGALVPSAFVSVAHPSPHQWIIRVPMNTDIDDDAFLARFRDAVESIWHLRDGDDEYRVELTLTKLSAGALYGGTAGCDPAAGCMAPRKGDRIDADAHAALFPPGAAGLTTGAASLYTIRGVIVLSAGRVEPHVLAHEFGHVLGLRDEYFRGYRDLGADGFRILEIVADPGDIMGDPGAGPVRADEFRRIVQAATK